jgi:hypothetical protein
MISLSTFNIIVITWTALAIVLLPLLLNVTAPYGRHSQNNWGPVVNNRLGWFLMEAPAFFVFVFFILKGGLFHQSAIFLFSLLWVMHYVHRVFIFPLRIKTKGKKMPLVIMLFALFFNFINGFINGYWFGYLSSGYSPDWFFDPRFITGVLIFIAGFVINQYHDRILIRLRKNSPNGYKIPFGGLFNLVSCPNFLGEIIEWAGFALMTWCLPTLSFFIWTFVNLVPRALDHHRWYIKNFQDYPKKRKALVPFLL